MEANSCRRTQRLLVCCLCLPWLLMVTGCGGGLPPVKAPSIDVEVAAKGAISEFDADGNGTVDKEEACQGIAAQWDRYDTNDDNAISEDEFVSRFSKWTTGDTGMMNLRVQLNFRNQPLTDAAVTMTPYGFLGENMLVSEGETDAYGYAFMAVPKDKLPKSQETNFGMQVGLFKVEITHPNRKLPAKYNTQTELSVDLSPSEANTGVRFNLK